MSTVKVNNIYLRKKRNNENKENIYNENIPLNKRNSIIRAKEILREFGRDITDLTNLTEHQNQKNSNLIKTNNTFNIKPYTNLAQQILNFHKKNDNNIIYSKKQVFSDIININKNNKNLKEESVLLNCVENKKIHKENKKITKENIQNCNEYINEIFSHLKETENLNLPLENYMEKTQSEINERMRIILLDWLIDVQLKFKLLPETLFLTINIIDRYLSISKATKENLQLIGITSMLIACKYEEIYFPEIKDFIYMTDDTYSKDEVLQMEYKILKKLEFNITNPSSLRFLEIYDFYLKLDNKIYFLAKYFLELSLVNYKQIKFLPSIIATSAIYLSKKQDVLFDENELWNITGYTFNDIEECYLRLKEYIFHLDNTQYLAVKRKYSSEKYFSVSKNFKIF